MEAAMMMFSVALGLYFLPTFVANGCGSKNIRQIFLLNLFLGWTFVGWVVALVWAAQKGDNAGKSQRVCPHCAETVLAAARVCRYCQHDLPPVRAAVENRQVILK